MNSADQSKADYKRAWRERNRERLLSEKKAWHLANKDRLKLARTNLTPEQIDERRRKARARYHADKERRLQRDKEYRSANKERIAARAREYRAARRAEHHLYDIKKRCNKTGTECTLTADWIRDRFDAGKCELTGVSFDMDGKRTPNSPSVDRIDPTGGYKPENCQMILWSLNRAFSNYGRPYLIDLFRKIIEGDS